MSETELVTVGCEPLFKKQEPFNVDIPVELDTELWAEQVAIEHEDGYEWKGDFLVGHMRIYAATQLSGAHPDDKFLKIVKIRAGRIAERILNGTSLAMCKGETCE